MRVFATGLLALGSTAASPTPAESQHHLKLMHQYEESIKRCEHGHSGVIVKLHSKSQKSPEELQLHLKNKNRAKDVFKHVFSKRHTIRAIAAHLSDETMYEMMADGKLHGIDSVHADCFRRSKMPQPEASLKSATVKSATTLAAVQSSTMSKLSGEQDHTDNWGLDHMDEVRTNGKASDGNYVYGTATGANTTLYHIDTGVQFNHHEFRNCRTDSGSRIVTGWSMGCTDVNDPEQKESCSGLWVLGGNITDEVLNRKNRIDDPAEGGVAEYTAEGRGCDGHGTHTAATVAGCESGVAKDAQIVVIQGLSCTATAQDSLVVKALDEVVTHARSQEPYRPGVVLLSLGGEKDYLLNEAVKLTTMHHIAVLVAAGNSHVDACTSTPSSVQAATTVAALDETDTLGSFSSYGRCVDIVAPGVDIKSAYPAPGDTNMHVALSGTSMATPYVAGATLQALSLFPQMTVEQSKAILRCTGSKGIVTGDREAINAGTPNVAVHLGAVWSSAAMVHKVIDEAHDAAMKSQSQQEGMVQTQKLSLQAVHGEALRSDCHQLVDLLESTRPPSGQLDKSPDVNYDSVQVNDGDVSQEEIDREEHSDGPFTQKAMSDKGPAPTGVLAP